MVSPPTENSARFIAAARRAARGSVREKGVGAPLINPSPYIDESIETSARPRKLMAGIKFLFMAASIAAIVIGSMQLMDHHVIFKNIATRVLGNIIFLPASDAALEQGASDIDHELKQLTSTKNLSPQNITLPQNTTSAGSAEEKRANSHGTPDAIVPSFLPTSANLFNTTALSHASEMIKGAPALLDPLISTAASTRVSNVDNNVVSNGVSSAPPAPKPAPASIPAPAPASVPAPISAPASAPASAITPADAHASAKITPPVEELPPTIGSERLRKAAMAGDPAAAYAIAQRYGEGHGVAINLEEAARWYKQAASGGVVPAQFRYATMLEKGQGVTKNLEQARQFYLAAAAKGDAKSMHNLAVLYAQGINGKPDYTNAIVWFRKAANHGIADSQFNLAVLFERGLGTKENLIEAYKWFALAAAQGDHESGNKRDDIASELNAEQLAAAQESVKAFTVKPQPKQALVDPTLAGGWEDNSEKRPAQSTPPLTNRPMVLGAFRVDSTE
jgi:TPR repeat protein